MEIHPIAPLVPNDVEQALLDRVMAGEMLDLGGDAFVVDQRDQIPAMPSWGPEHTIRAIVIRDILRGRLTADLDPYGLRLRGARIEGTLDLEYLTTNVPIELIDCLLTDGVVMRGASLPAVTLQRCFLAHPSQPPLIADRLVTAMLVLTRSIVATHSEDGGVRLEGAHLGQFKADNAIVDNDKGPALYADWLRVDQDVFLIQASAIGTGQNGAVRLIGAHIGGHLDFTGATLTNNGDATMAGPALIADGLKVDQSLFLRLGKATGAGENGTVRLLGAHIGGQLSLAGATLTNTTGPALHAEKLNVDQNLLAGPQPFRGLMGFPDQAEFTATGDSDLGTVRLLGAHVGGQLDFTGATLTNQTGPALDARNLTVGHDLIFAGEFAAQGNGDGVVLDLGMVQIGGGFYFRRDKVSHATCPGALLNVDGLTYVGLPKKGATKERPAKPATKEWLQLIREGTRSYAAQPYQLLATVLGAAGNDREARDVLIAQRQDQIDRNALTGWGERTWARFTGVMIGYGYKPSRALFFLLCVAILSVVLSVALGAHGGLVQSSPPAEKPAVQCTTLEQFAFGLDLGTSLFSTNAGCDTTTSATGNGLAVVSWTTRILAWALATLFIAGFTSAVRKN